MDALFWKFVPNTIAHCRRDPLYGDLHLWDVIGTGNWCDDDWLFSPVMFHTADADPATSGVTPPSPDYKKLKHDVAKKDKEDKAAFWSEVISLGHPVRPEDVHISTKDGLIIVKATGKHHHKASHGHQGYSIIHSSRTLSLPKNVDSESIKVCLNSEGDIKMIGYKLGDGDKAIETPKKMVEPPAQKGETAAPTTTGAKQKGDGTDGPAECSMETGGENTAVPEVTDRRIVKAPWSLQINIDGFKPEDLQVKVKGHTVTVLAECTERNEEEGSYSHKKIERMVSLPPDVITEQLHSFVGKSGELQLTAPVRDITYERQVKVVVDDKEDEEVMEK